LFDEKDEKDEKEEKEQEQVLLRSLNHHPFRRAFGVLQLLFLRFGGQ
jgi:hypothetical protein